MAGFIDVFAQRQLCALINQALLALLGFAEACQQSLKANETGHKSSFAGKLRQSVVSKAHFISFAALPPYGVKPFGKASALHRRGGPIHV